MDKRNILPQILAALNADLELLSRAARAAHAAATHEECIPDNKYDTTGLEASYVAQGQANRAQDIRRALERYRVLELRPFAATTPIRLTALVTLEDEDGNHRQVFLGPDAGGLKLTAYGGECIVITPDSTLGRALLGKVCGDEFDLDSGAASKSFTIIAVA
jgi:transcription elongation GreA/GreB family factor